MCTESHQYLSLTSAHLTRNERDSLPTNAPLTLPKWQPNILSSVVDADRIFVARDKRIVEQGSHAELVGLNGYYAELLQVQERKYLG